jgi:transposase
LSLDELERRYRAAKEPHERSWWQILWLLARGQLAKDIAESTGYSRYWIGQIAKRYNAEGPEGMHNRQYTHSHRAAALLAGEQLAALAAAVRGPAPGGDDWTGRLVAEWMSETLGRPVSAQVGWVYLVRLDGKRLKPRPRHVLADPEQQAAFKKSSARSSKRSRPRTPRRASSSGPSTSTALG